MKKLIIMLTVGFAFCTQAMATHTASICEAALAMAGFFAWMNALGQVTDIGGPCAPQP